MGVRSRALGGMDAMKNLGGVNVLVTGATGLLGSWLVKELLAQGADVSVFYRDGDMNSELFRSGDIRRVRPVVGDLRCYADVNRAVCESGAQCVFHLGAQSQVGVARRSPLHTIETNILGTANVLEAASLSVEPVHVVVASSDKAYGDHGAESCIESAELKGIFPYDASKACADILVRSYATTYQQPVSVVRCANIFGGGDLNWARLIPGTIRSLLYGVAPPIRSNGMTMREYVYVRDAVDGYIAVMLRLMTCGADRAYNLSFEQPRMTLDVVADLAKITNREHLKPDVLSVETCEIPEQRLCAERARQHLGWGVEKPVFYQQLVDTVLWYREFLGIME